MTIISILLLAAIYLLSVCYALRKGCDVKAALKIPFFAFTLETNGNKSQGAAKVHSPRSGFTRNEKS